MSLRHHIFALAAVAVTIFGVPSAAWAAAPGVPEALRISESPNAGFQQCFTPTAPSFDEKSGPQFSASPAGTQAQPGLNATLEIGRPGEEPFLRRTEATWPSGYVWGFGISPGTFTPGSYQFRMRAENAEGTSAWSNWCAFTVTGVPKLDAAYSPDGGKHCLEVKDNATTDGSRVQLGDCAATPGQNWRIIDADGTLRNPHSGKCLDVAAGFTFNGAKVQLYTCNGTGAQTWHYHQPTTGAFSNPRSGKCLEVPGSNLTTGTAVQIYTCNGTNAQTWTQVTVD